MAALKSNFSHRWVLYIKRWPQQQVSARYLSSKESQRPSKPSTSFEYCQELVNKNDFENFLATLLLPPGSRESAISIRAFNVAVASVRDQVTQKTIGQMRMKFWADALDAIYEGNPPAQPVTIQLHKAVRKHKLSKRWLQRVIASREEILNDKSFPSLEALDTYSENSVSSVLYLTLECINVRNVHSDHAASHIGRAQGVVTLLRAVPFNAVRQRVYIPLDLLVKHKVSQQSIIRGSAETNVKDLFFDLASTANAHLQKAASLTQQVPTNARVALLPAVAAASYLERLRQADFNVYDGELQQRNRLLPWYLWWNKFRNTY